MQVIHPFTQNATEEEAKVLRFALMMTGVQKLHTRSVSVEDHNEFMERWEPVLEEYDSLDEIFEIRLPDDGSIEIGVTKEFADKAESIIE